MSNDIQQQTTVNIQEKANLIWAIADKLVGVYKPHEYGNVILPMCVIKRFEDTLNPTKQQVLETNAKLDKEGIVVKKGFLESAAGQQFYNLSPFTFQSLLGDPENIKDNFESYLNHFSENVIDIIHRMDFDRELQKMADNGVLYLVIKEFCTQKAYLGADQVTSVDMGYIFEELVRKFSESYDEQAGAHFTARDIIYLMAELLVGDNEEQLEQEGITASIYDMAMGTSQMLGNFLLQKAQENIEGTITIDDVTQQVRTYYLSKTSHDTGDRDKEEADRVSANIAKFTSGLWQIHAFCEGNTRTTAVFLIQYLRSIGFHVNNDMFARHSWYFRNALVRANYKNVQKGIDYTPIYLERFFRNLLLDDGWELRNKYLHICPPEEWKEQPNLKISDQTNPTSTRQVGDK